MWETGDADACVGATSDVCATSEVVSWRLLGMAS